MMLSESSEVPRPQKSEHQIAIDLEQFAFWLRYASRGRRPLSEGTIRSYFYTVRRFLQFLDEQEIDQDTAEKFIWALGTSGNSPRSIGRHIYALLFYFAFRGIELQLGAPAYQKRLPRWLTREEWSRLLATTEAPLSNPHLPERPRARARFHRAVLMAYGGADLRLLEGCSLQREDIDAAGHIKVLGKGGVENVVTVENAVVGAIQEWLGTHDSPWACPGRNGGHLYSRTMQAAVLQLMMAAGIKDIRLAVHTLRHAVGADWRRRGADSRDIQDVLRNASVTPPSSIPIWPEKTCARSCPADSRIHGRASSPRIICRDRTRAEIVPSALMPIILK